MTWSARNPAGFVLTGQRATGLNLLEGVLVPKTSLDAFRAIGIRGGGVNPLRHEAAQLDIHPLVERSERLRLGHDKRDVWFARHGRTGEVVYHGGRPLLSKPSFCPGTVLPSLRNSWANYCKK